MFHYILVPSFIEIFHYKLVPSFIEMFEYTCVPSFIEMVHYTLVPSFIEMFQYTFAPSSIAMFYYIFTYWNVALYICNFIYWQFSSCVLPVRTHVKQPGILHPPYTRTGRVWFYSSITWSKSVTEKQQEPFPQTGAETFSITLHRRLTK